MIFLDFVNSIASGCDVNVGNENELMFSDADEKWEIITNSVCDIMKTKIHRLDKVELPFIENTFSNTRDVTNTLNLAPTEIPDGVINNLTERLYNKKVSELSDDESNIIKVLTAYICLQIKSKD